MMPTKRKTEGRQTRAPTVLITGASGGIGRALCRTFAHNGWVVGVHYRQRIEEARQTLDFVREAGSDGAIYQADIRSSDAVLAMVNAIRTDYQALDAMICNAGTADGHLVIRCPESEWVATIETNLTGTFHCLQAAAAAMIDRGGGGIVVVGSYAGAQGSRGQAAYAASKAGLVGLVKTAAREWGPSGIRVNLVYPGWKATPLAGNAMPSDEAFRDHTLGRPSGLDEVARTIYLLALLKGVSGQIWNLDSRVI
jgi:3-oxoacyl-[acyl-carrier protein] reductase